MGHPNFKHILGQVISLPLPVGARYEDDFIIAHPITSLIDLTTDEYFKEFLEAKALDIYLSENVKQRVIDLCYYDDQFYENPLPELDSYYQTVSVLSGIGISWGHNNDYRAYKNSQNLQVYEISIPRISVSYSNFGGKFSGYFYNGYLPVNYRTYHVQVATSSSPTGNTAVAGDEKLIFYNLRPSYDTDFGFYTNNSLRCYIPGDMYYTPFPDSYPLPIGTEVVVNRDYLPSYDDSLFIDTKSGMPLLHYIYFNSLSDASKRDNPIYENCFTVPSIGVNMLVITAVKKNEFKEDEGDLEYLKSQVGEVFHSVLCAEHVLSCPSLEIHPLSYCHLGNTRITRKDYPEFFAMYSCDSEDPLYPSEVIFGEGHIPGNIDQTRTLLPNLRSLRQTSSEEIPSTILDRDGKYYVDEDLLLNGDRVTSSSVFLLQKPFLPREVKSGETYVQKIYPKDKKLSSGASPSTGSMDNFYTTKNSGGINPQDIKVFTYVIVKSKL